MNTVPLIFVLYDGINNSVFESQVKNLLQKKAQDNPYRPIHLVTVESQKSPLYRCKNMQITYLRRMPFIGFPTILYAAYQLRSFLCHFPEYSIIARGPLAGAIARKAITKKACKQFTVQARGLLAQEYAYTAGHKKVSPLMRLVYRLRTAQLDTVEKQAYRTDRDITIQAVSPALKEHLEQKYAVTSDCITLAQEDIPSAIPAAQKKAWRTTIRKELNISEKSPVYCYNGSAKPWQKPDDIIAFFKEKLTTEPDAFLLIITTDEQAFSDIIGATIAPEKYSIITVAHDEIFQYLCAADYGLLLRDEHIINWIARPTKAIEYQAAGLEIIHNNTVSYLIDNLK